MTIESDTLKSSHVGNSSATIFPYEFRILTEEEIQVLADNVELTLTTDYTVDGVGNLNGGNITFVTAPATGVSLVFLQNPDFTQVIDYNELDAFPAESHEEGLDRGAIRDMVLLEKANRSLAYSPDTTTTVGTIEEPTNNYLLAFDGTTGAIKGVAVGSVQDNLDTSLNSLADNDFLVYNTSGNVWENRTPANARSDLGLGTAAVYNVGTGANNVVQLSASAKLPALTAGAAIAMDTNKITGMGDPTNAQDAATKAYVDTTISSEFIDNSTAAKAWGYFDGTAGTPAFILDYNFGTITDNGAGDYTCAFTTSLGNANYTTVSTASTGTVAGSEAKATGSVRVVIYDNNSDTALDSDDVNLVIFGDF